jgi:hypothetical protein
MPTTPTMPTMPTMPSLPTTLDIHSNSDTSGFHVPSALVNITYIPTLLKSERFRQGFTSRSTKLTFGSLSDQIPYHCKYRMFYSKEYNQVKVKS